MVFFRYQFSIAWKVTLTTNGERTCKNSNCRLPKLFFSFVNTTVDDGRKMDKIRQFPKILSLPLKIDKMRTILCMFRLLSEIEIPVEMNSIKKWKSKSFYHNKNSFNAFGFISHCCFVGLFHCISSDFFTYLFLFRLVSMFVYIRFYCEHVSMTRRKNE